MQLPGWDDTFWRIDGDPGAIEVFFAAPVLIALQRSQRPHDEDDDYASVYGCLPDSDGEFHLATGCSCYSIEAVSQKQTETD